MNHKAAAKSAAFSFVTTERLWFSHFCQSQGGFPAEKIGKRIAVQTANTGYS
jgi:hypothetical protein